MAVLDIILLVIFIPAIIRGISKGFVEQLVALLSLFASAYLAFLFADSVSEWLSHYISLSSPTVLYVLAFIIVVVLCVFILRLVGKLLSKVLDALSLGWIDRILGFLLAVFNTAIIIGLLMTLFNDLNAHYFHLSTQFMQDSVVYSWIEKFTDTLFPYLKSIFASMGTPSVEV